MILECSRSSSKDLASAGIDGTVGYYLWLTEDIYQCELYRTISSTYDSGVQGLQVEELWSLEEDSFEQLKLVQSLPTSSLA